MYLKALEIQGFKSFPDKTRLTFEKDITAVVGPNGSGKSNISDAILWVMGEQSSKTLRGSKMEDVIFGRTSQRSPMGYAEVSLIIDNSQRIIDSDFLEIALTRRYFRSGVSEYFINHEEVRLKDINSLLMDTGLGRDGYSIISQGRIADIVSTKSTDRREVFDEAAGISRYRYRKEEAERRLERTDENLLRINDKIGELEFQVEPLRKQAEVAKKYLVLRDKLKTLEISSWMDSLDKLHEKAQSINIEYEQTLQELSKAQNVHEALFASIESLSDRMHDKEEEIEKARDTLLEKENSASEIESAITVLETKIAACADTKERLVADISEQESQSEEIKSTIAQNNARIDIINSEISSLKKQLEENSNKIDGCRMKINNREAAVNTASDKLNRLSAERMSVESRISMLESMEKEYEGYSKAVKTVMRESSHSVLRGIHGPVSRLIKTEDDYTLAIETALGASAQNIVVDRREDGQSAIELLKNRDSGRATFLPLDTINGNVLTDVPDNEYGFVGLAIDLVKFDSKYHGIIASLLGRTVVVDELGDAVRISKKYKDRYRIVTLDGQMINAGGSMTGGSNVKGAGMLSRANELEELRKNVEKFYAQESSMRKEIEQSKFNLSALKYDLDAAIEEKNDISSSMSSYTAELHSLLDTTDKFNDLLAGISSNSDQRRNAYNEAQRKIDEYNRQIADKKNELSSARDAITGQRAVIAAISNSRLELEGKQSKANSEMQDASNKIIEFERIKNKIESRKLSSEMEEKNIVEKLWDSYELSYSTAQNIRQPIENFPNINKEISDLKKGISQLGTPNLGAVDEFERVNERYEFLKSQRDDVEKAKNELLGIIREVTDEMKTAFAASFKLIDAAFRQTFTELFGGGTAALVLEDEENILECGIEIKVQPPGKQLSMLSLMSGGEMAFVAIALYFAILKVRPTPFCVMDEIEAALDEANVSRFAEYMRKISDRTQFIVITHRRGTMEEADMLYGVTMQEKGVSTVLELDIEEAKKSAKN